MQNVPDTLPPSEYRDDDEFRSPTLRAMRAVLGLTDHHEWHGATDKRTIGDLLADALADNRDNVVGGAFRRLADELEVVAFAFQESGDLPDLEAVRRVLRAMGTRARVAAEVFKRQLHAAEDYAATVEGKVAP